jgi:hypothetical protein
LPAKMPDVESELHFLADIPRYKEEKPYNVILAAEAPLPTESELPLSNIEPEPHPVFIKDFRDHVQDMTVREHGFQLIGHTTKAGFDRNWETIAAYRAETEAMLKKSFDADFVLCWDYKVREILQMKLLGLGERRVIVTECRRGRTTVQSCLKERGTLTICGSERAFQSCPIAVSAAFALECLRHCADMPR